ncbi:MAG: GspH/FimT family protein [Gammaproteobacteria bacterium]
MPDGIPCTGFTVADLLIALALAAVLTTTAVPAFTDMLLEARMTRQVNGLVRGVHLAKQTAQLRLRDVAICKSPDGRRCGHDGRWHDGWLLFVNTDRDYPPTVGTDEPALASGGAWTGGRIFSNRRFFIFRPATIRSTNGTLTFCDRRGEAGARALVISYTGRPRISRRAPRNRPLICQA